MLPYVPETLPLQSLDALTAEAERGIELLQERRTALAFSALTGQIDVRESLREGAEHHAQ